MKYTKNQISGFIPGIIKTMSEVKIIFVKTADRTADMVTKRKKTGFGQGNKCSGCIICVCSTLAAKDVCYTHLKLSMI